MAVQSEAIFAELHQLFEDLKTSSAKCQAAEESNKDSGDNLTAKSTQDGLQEMVVRLDEILAQCPKDDGMYVKLVSMKSSLLYERAKILLSLENYPGCQVFLENALEIVEELSGHKLITYLYLRLMNHLAYVLSREGNLKKSKEVLEKITSMKLSGDVQIYSTEELFSTGEIDQSEAPVKLYRLTINNLQMLGWVCSKMGLDMEYAAKQHAILQHQLNFGECDPVDWATRCARLAILYMSKMNWVAARYHLSAASSILDQLERDMVPHPELGKAQAEIARGWIYYGVRLFDASKTLEANRRCNMVFESTSLTDSKHDKEAADGENKIKEDPLDPELRFNGCDVKVEDIPAMYIQCSEDARLLFFQTHIWLKRARMFYTLRDHPYIYVNCVLDLSELYRYLAYFEPDLECQYNVQKRRADALETLSGLLKDVRPQCYISVSVEILRELAEVHMEMMGLNLKRNADNVENLSRKMQAVAGIHSKLEKFGDVMVSKGQLDGDQGPSGTCDGAVERSVDEDTSSTGSDLIEKTVG